MRQVTNFPLQLVLSEPNLPHVHMQHDGQALQAFSHEERKAPILHCYNWSVPSLTYGYFARPEALLHLEALQAGGWHAAKRPTGGGVIFHVSDFAFSLLIPNAYVSTRNPYRNYAWINQLVLKAITPLFGLGGSVPVDLAKTPCQEEGCENIAIGCLRPAFCMAEISPFDLVIEGKKVGGAAQRHTRHGLLHQGSLYLTHPPFEAMQTLLQDGKRIVQAMRLNSRPLIEEVGVSEKKLQEVRGCLTQALYRTFSAISNSY